MKILCFYSYSDKYDYDNWLHMKFMEVVDKYPGIEVVCYGPGLEIKHPEIVPIRFDPKLSMSELCKRLQPDVVIVMTKSRMFEGYNPHECRTYERQHSNCWMPYGFGKFDILKIVLEEDYHYEIDDRWYQETGIDLILQRHHCAVKRQQKVKMQWFPFSVDIDVFYPGVRERKAKVCFAGSVNRFYPKRALAITVLGRENLIDIYDSKEKVGTSYISALQNYRCHLSGSSIFGITPAKMFEIMACGSVLLTNREKHFEEIFDEGSYVVFDGDDVVERTRKVLNDQDYRREIVSNALACIMERHTHQIRIEELLHIIKNI